MESVFSDYDVWSFKKDDRDRWVWRRESPDGELLLEARASFEGLDQCVEDASRSGYSGALTVRA